MTEQEIDRIIQEKLRKYVLPTSAKTFHFGLILLVSLVIGVGYFQFEPMPPDLAPEDASTARLGFGVWLGFYLAAGGSVLYFIWRLWQGYKIKKEAEAEIFAEARKRLERRNS